MSNDRLSARQEGLERKTGRPGRSANNGTAITTGTGLTPSALSPSHTAAFLSPRCQTGTI
ncbi:hypothetical protein EYF80_006961 [Liparis tanakae]|uniref:Uncharacterized protein n=1 Tax=Liparis tanakae TaxID=230148 RepID=A0A4Z2IXM3_9TELE|nr:hypothetical protein EYF80_006961 [Liparis tanakae]